MAVGSGLIFYLLGNLLNSNIKNLFHNISAAFFVIPLLYLLYELTKMWTDRELNKEIYDFIKVQVDSEILSIVNKLMKMIQGYGQQRFSLSDIRHFLRFSRQTMECTLKNQTFLGFQVFKEWDSNEHALQLVLSHSFISSRLSNKYAISIIKLIKNLRSLKQLLRNFKVFIEIKNPKVCSKMNYQLIKGKEVDPFTSTSSENTSETYMLIKPLDGAKGRLVDFGNFGDYYESHLLDIYRMNEDYINLFINEILDILKDIECWLSITGNEFIVDTTIFRIAKYDGLETTFYKKQ
jgi:hypothetical protein